MATFSNPIKINAVVNASRSSNGTIYTAPATGYSMVTICYTAANLNLQYDGITISSPSLITGLAYYNFLMGGGKSLVISGWVNGTVQVSGVEFVNNI